MLGSAWPTKQVHLINWPVVHYERKINKDPLSYLVDIGTLLANVVPGIFLLFAALNVEECCVFMLVPQTTFVASEDGLSIEPVQDRNKIS